MPWKEWRPCPGTQQGPENCGPEGFPSELVKQGAEMSLAGSPVTLTEVSWDIDAVGQNRDAVIHEFEP